MLIDSISVSEGEALTHFLEILFQYTFIVIFPLYWNNHCESVDMCPLQRNQELALVDEFGLVFLDVFEEFFED